ncbi:MAG TPA: hypothetical protein VMU87_18140 [Stellaceae bacterium]|nr:hypothetical protein [Stellaceae bacterium]
MRLALVMAAVIALGGCVPPAYVPIVAAGLGACAAACAPVVGLERDAFDFATGQTAPAVPK